jgi:fibronectin-binding autotransporter adhesin
LIGNGALPTNNRVSVIANGTTPVFDISGTTTGTTVGSVGTTGTNATVALGSKILITGGNNDSRVINIITGSGQIIKKGTGSLTTNIATNFTGSTTVEAGTLIVTGGGEFDTNATSGKVIVTGATALNGFVNVSTSSGLYGDGVIQQFSDISTGGSVSPSDFQTEVGTTNLTFSNGFDLAGSFVWNLSALTTSNVGADSDRITVTGGNVDITGATLQLELGAFAPSTNAFWNTDRTWTGIINNSGAGALTGAFSNINNSLWTSEGFFSTENVGNDVNLKWTAGAIPEPGLYSLLSITGTLALLGYRKR